MRGNRYRIPRKIKKAMHRHFAGKTSARDLRVLARCWCLSSQGGWARVRRHLAHVAMGDTSRMRAEVHFNRARQVREAAEVR